MLTKDQLLELGNKDLAAGLNKLGAEGWELAAVDGQYIFKRHKLRDQIEELERQIGVIESDVESWRDRVAWAERMVKKGFMTDQHLQFERAQLIKTENALDAARKALKSLPSEPKGSADKQPKRE